MEQNVLFSILRILTPQEIGELATSSEVQEKRSLTEMMAQRFFLNGNNEEEDEAEASEAKILPFKNDQDEVLDAAEGELEEEIVEVKEEDIVSEEDVDSEEKKSFSLSDMFRPEEVVVEERVDTIKFILEEKEKFKKSRRDLKGKEIMKLYQSNASVSIEQEKKNKKNLSKSTHAGVLINKKQA